MYIRRVAVRDWRGLEEAELDDLAPGLNLISGPNESGKSRLVQALWYGLFESSKGSAQNKKDLASWGTGSRKPQVSVDFELGGEPWTVEKVFLAAGTNTTLRSAARERLIGEAAEARLRALLSVGEPTNRGLRREDAGIWPLLWVDQLQSAEAPTREAGDDARHRLHDRLTAEVGEVAAGERGQALLQRAKERRDRYYTAGRGDETGPLKAARAHLESCEAKLAEARARRDAVASDADALQVAQESERDLAERLRIAEAKLAEARKQLGQARTARDQLKDAERQKDAAQQRRDDAVRRREERAQAEAALAERDAAVQAARAALDEAHAALAQHEAGVAEMTQAATQAEAQAKAARDALEDLRTAERRASARAKLADLRTRLKDAREIDAAIRNATRALAELPNVSTQDVQALQTLQDRRNRARAALDGASVRVTLQPVRPLTVDGEALPAGEPRVWTVDDDRSFAIEGVGELRIAPGGGELARLRDALRDAEAALAGRLQALEVPSLDAARSTERTRDDLQRTRATERQRLAREAPDGLPALEAEVAAQEQQLGLEPGAVLPEVAPVAPDAMESAQAADVAAREAVERARQRRDAAVERRQQAGTGHATAKTRLEVAAKEQAAQRERLAALPAAGVLAQACTDAERQLADCIAKAEAAQRAFEAAGGDDAEADVERREKGAAQLREARNRRDREIGVLEDRLRAVGEEGRHEHVQDLEAETGQARADLARIEAEAQSARRLHQVLADAARAARKRLAGPVVKRIGPYLRELFPGTEVWLDETMSLQGLRAGTRGEEPFDALSGGAREQLSLLVRIGLAEVLGVDESWPLVLDDALVNTDPDRIQSMQRLLFRASKQMQLLLFTCHGRHYDALGVDRHVELVRRGRGG
mgnify:CR=1 FL=1